MMTNVLPCICFGMIPLCTVGTPHQVGRCWHARGGHSIHGVRSSEPEDVLEVALDSRLNLFFLLEKHEQAVINRVYPCSNQCNCCPAMFKAMSFM